MPLEGLDQLPYPNTSDAPDGPGAFLALAQRLTAMKGAGIAYAATNGIRVALQATDVYVGLVCYDAQDNAYYQWTGSTWLVLPIVQDFPLAPASAASAAQQTIVAPGYAALPTTPVTAALNLTHAETLVQVKWSAQFGAGTIGAPSNTGFLSPALSGAFTQAASDASSISGTSPGVTGSATGCFDIVAPAGTLTANLQAHYGIASGFVMRSFFLQLTALREA